MKKGLARKRYKKRQPFFKAVVFIVFIFFIILLFMSCIDNKVFDIVIEISHMKSKLLANEMINQSVKNTIQKMNIASSDFFIDNASDLNSISANTILINDFCANVSDEITKQLMEISDERIKVPLGSATGIDFFSNMGPEIPFSLRPEGTTEVDYETGFESVGINQVNFKIWINVNLVVQIVNPLRKEKMILTRKIMLVDTVISGQVPNQYLDFNR